MLDIELKLMALSAIVGCPVKSIKNTGQLGPFQKYNPGQLQPVLLHPQNMIDIAIDKKPLKDFTSTVKPEIFVLIPPTPAAAAAAPAPDRHVIFMNEDDFFDPPYDYDFTNIKDGATKYYRGGEEYRRPCGWDRIALKVLGKYKDGDGWLEMGDDAWPVSYHGTTDEGAKSISEGYYKAGEGKAYGRGIYSTPDVAVALGYSKTFTYKKKTYNVILQNRINKKKREKCSRDDYWLVPVPKGTSADKEKQISEESIRPYGLLLREEN